MNTKNTASMVNAPEDIPSNILTVSSNIFSFLLCHNDTFHDLKAEFLKLKQTCTQHIFETDICDRPLFRLEREECSRIISHILLNRSFFYLYWERGVFLINKGEGRRSNLDIIADILGTSRRGVKKTHLMQNGSMNFAQLGKYLDLILEARLLYVENDGSRLLFKISGKGKSFLKAYESLKALMK